MGRGRLLPQGAACVNAQRPVESVEGSGSHIEFKDNEGNQKDEGMRGLESGKVKAAQSCPTLCDPTHCTAHGIFQARILEWVGSLSLLQGIFPTQESNWGLLH